MGFGNLGFGEIIFILLILLLVFGARRLPEIGQSLGKGIREFKKSMNEISGEFNNAVQPPPQPPQYAPPMQPYVAQPQQPVAVSPPAVVAQPPAAQPVEPAGAAVPPPPPPSTMQQG